MRWIPIFLAGVLGCSGGSDDDNPDVDDTAAEIVPADPYRTISEIFEWGGEQIDGRGVRWHVPENPRGLMWVFHGTNGSVSSVMQAEWVLLYNQLAQRRIAFAATSSANREEGIFDTEETDPARNADFPVLRGAFERLVETTDLTADVPMGAIGFSRGTTASAFFGQMMEAEGWNFRVTSMHSGGGYFRNTAHPSVFVSAENDTSTTPEAMIASQKQCLGVHPLEDCPIHHGLEIPLDPRRLARLPQFSQEQSAEAFDELVELSLVDGQGDRAFDLADLEDELMRYERNSDFNASMAATQLRVVWATHRFSGEFAFDEAAFIESILLR
ncbi:MAG: hypothetical protein KTR31_03115 [Myxococcales bacterium]|nr:hypothetical protein [Myxococcales bacterium]